MRSDSKLTYECCRIHAWQSRLLVPIHSDAHVVWQYHGVWGVFYLKYCVIIHQATTQVSSKQHYNTYYLCDILMTCDVIIWSIQDIMMQFYYFVMNLVCCCLEYDLTKKS